jgi:hypothetical protein
MRDDATSHRSGALACTAILLGTLLWTGCGEAPGATGWTVETDTLPGGTVRVVNHPPPAEVGPDWTLEEELRIGAVEGEGPATFGEVKGLAVTDDGCIAVLDAQAREVRVFAPDGAHLITYGRQGEGPGELQAGYGLMLGPEGRLWVPDNRLDRMTVFDPDSGYVDSWDFTILRYGYIWGGKMTDEGTVWKPSMTMAGNRDPFLRVYGPGMTLLDTLPMGMRPDVDPEDPPSSFYWEAPDGMPRGYIGVPWYPSGQTSLDPAGAIWATERGDPAYRIKRWVPGGDTTLVIENRRPPVAVSEVERDSAIDYVRDHLRERGADASRDWSRIPEHKPPVSGMFVADDGNLWVQIATPAADSITAFDVYEPDGRLAGTLVTDLRPQGTPGAPAPIVRGDRMWAVVTDELDVDYVVRARIVDAADE